MDFEEFSGKTVEDAITEACTKFTVPSSELEYEVIEKGNAGFLGINSRPALIRARVAQKNEEELKKDDIISEVKAENSEKALTAEKAPESKEEKKEEKEEEKKDPEKKAVHASEEELKEIASKFLIDVFKAMDMEVTIDARLVEEDAPCLEIDLSGDEMGVLIGKRGQTLDSLQYLVSLVLNKGKGEYVRVKIDTEDYRKRRKETLENLAKNLSYKVKRTRRSVSLEPMNPYERRIIHSALQNDKIVTTYSEGEEPYRRVVIALKKS